MINNEKRSPKPDTVIMVHLPNIHLIVAHNLSQKLALRHLNFSFLQK